MFEDKFVDLCAGFRIVGILDVDLDEMVRKMCKKLI